MPVHTRTRSRRARFDPSVLPAATNAVATCAVAANKWQLDFSNPVQVISLPMDFTVNGNAPTAFVQSSATRVTLSFAVNVAAGQAWVIPNRSPNVRTPTGGFVASAAGTF